MIYLKESMSFDNIHSLSKKAIENGDTNSKAYIPIDISKARNIKNKYLVIRDYIVIRDNIPLFKEPSEKSEINTRYSKYEFFLGDKELTIKENDKEHAWANTTYLAIKHLKEYPLKSVILTRKKFMNDNYFKLNSLTNKKKL